MADIKIGAKIVGAKKAIAYLKKHPEISLDDAIKYFQKHTKLKFFNGNRNK